MIELTKKSIVLHARYVEVRKTALVYDLNTTDTNAKFQDYDGTTSNANKVYTLTDSGDASEFAGRINSIYTVGTEINDTKTRAARIEVKKGNSPFVVKVEKSGKGSSGVSIKYTIE